MSSNNSVPFYFNSITTRDENLQEFTNSVDLDDVAHNVHCLLSSL